MSLLVTPRSTKDFKWHRAHASPNWAVLEDVVVTLSKLEHAKAVDVYGEFAANISYVCTCKL